MLGVHVRTLAGPDRRGDAILWRGDRAGPVFVIGAERVVDVVEVQPEVAVVESVDFEISSYGICLVARGSVSERQKERAVFILAEDRKCFLLAVDIGSYRRPAVGRGHSTLNFYD